MQRTCSIRSTLFSSMRHTADNLAAAPTIMRTTTLATLSGLTLVGAAFAHAVWVPAPPPVPAGIGVSTGPDLILSEIFDLRSFGTLQDVSAFAIGTSACNIGDAPATWVESTSAHPVIAQNLYRLSHGRFEQIGMSWLKHGMAAYNNPGCLPGDCQSTYIDSLGVNCSDPYSAGMNGNRHGLGPRSEVNAYTGLFPFPHGGSAGPYNVLSRRLLALNEDLDPLEHPGARFFVEGIYVSPDDAALNRGGNNASFREVTITWDVDRYRMAFVPGEPTHTEAPALEAWAMADPDVLLSSVDAPDDGELRLASRAYPLGQGFWRYEYALFNLNCDRAVRAFAIPITQGVHTSHAGVTIPRYHSGEVYPNDPWRVGKKNGYQYFASAPYWRDPKANALRWGTTASFWFVARKAPTARTAQIELFKPGAAQHVSIATIGPR